MKKYLFSEIAYPILPFAQFQFEIKNKEFYINENNYEFISALFDKNYIKAGKYQFIKQFNFNEKQFIIRQILDREKNFSDLDILFKNRQFQWDNDKSKNDLISIGAVPGAGKTTFGLYYGLTRCQKGSMFFNNFQSDLEADSCQTIPLYATFNNNTSYYKLEIDEEQLLSTRIMFDFLNSIHIQGGKNSNEYMEFEEFRDSLKINKTASQIIKIILSLSQRKAMFLFVDEITKIQDEELLKKFITMLGVCLDNNKNLHILVSTLDNVLLNLAMTPSQRIVKYIYMKSLTSIQEYIEQDKQLGKMGRAVKIAMLEISSVPRAVDSAILMLRNDENEHLLSENYEVISRKFANITSIALIMKEIKKQDKLKALFLAALNSVLKQDKNIEYQDTDSIIDFENDGTVGMCLKYGIFITIQKNFPLMNLVIVNAILNYMKNKKQIQQWMPAHYFLKISDINFDHQKISQLEYSKEFEIFMAKIDIFYRVFNYYNMELLPKQREDKKIEKKIKYSDLFQLQIKNKTQVVFGEADNEFQIQPEYTLDESFSKQHYIGKTHHSCFDYFAVKDWKTFFGFQTVYLNIHNGSGFDSVVFHAPYYITFFQDKSRQPDLQDIDQNQREIITTYKNCQQIFSSLQKNNDFNQILAENNLKFEDIKIRLIFRALKVQKNEENQHSELKKINLIIVDKKSLLDRTIGVFDLKVQFISDQKIE